MIKNIILYFTKHHSPRGLASADMHVITRAYDPRSNAEWVANVWKKNAIRNQKELNKSEQPD